MSGAVLHRHAPEQTRSSPRAAPTTPDRRAPANAAAIAGLVGLLVYASTAAPGVQGGDSGEFQFVAYILGIPHPPGYPLYALVGKIWTLVFPFGEVAYRMNILSAVFAAATLAALAWSGAVVHARPGPGLAPGLVSVAWLALAPTWWMQATIASVRPPTGFFVAAILAALGWFGATRSHRALYIAAAVYGLSLTHHISLYTLAPAIVAFVLVTSPGVLGDRGVLRRVLLSGLAPLVVYAYLPIRSAIGAPFDASRPTTPRAFFDLITARGFAGDMFFFDPFSAERLELARQILLTNFGVWGVSLAVVGAVVVLIFHPRWALLTVGIAATNLVIGLSYRAPVIADYLIPTYVVMALWIGALAALPVRALGRAGTGRAATAIVGGAVALALMTPPLIYAGATWRDHDMSGDRRDEAFLADAFGRAAPGATILADWHHATVLLYGQYGRGERPDLTVDYVGPEGEEVPWLRKTDEALARGPVYVTGLDRRLGERFHLQRHGALYAVQTAAERDLPSDAQTVGITYGDGLELAAIRLEHPAADADVSVSLFWRARQPPGRDLSEFVHLTDATGRVWGQRDGTPGEGFYPTSRWRVGEVVAERYSLAVARGGGPGRYDLRVGLYETTPGGWRRLSARGTTGEHLGDAPVVGTVQLEPRVFPLPPSATASSLSRRLVGRLERFVRGDRADGVVDWAARSDGPWVPFGHTAILQAWALDRETASPGEVLKVALDWVPLRRIPEDIAAFVHLVDGAGRLRVQNDGVPVGGGLPTLRWAPGRAVRDVRSLRLPADLPDGTYTLRAGMYVMATGAPLSVLDDALARAGQGDHVVLGDLVVRR